MELIELKTAFYKPVPVFEWRAHIYAQLQGIQITDALQLIPVVELNGLDFYYRNDDRGPVAFLDMESNESHAYVLTTDDRLVRRPILQFALKIEVMTTTF